MILYPNLAHNNYLPPPFPGRKWKSQVSSRIQDKGVQPDFGDVGSGGHMDTGAQSPTYMLLSLHISISI